MPIAYPSPADPAPERRDEGATPADERDRTRTRTRVGGAPPETGPRTSSDAPSTPTGNAEGAREGADPRARLVPVDDTGGEVVPFPGGEIPQRSPDVLRVWFGEARETATRAVDGSVYRARPPALRDSVERLRRAEWAGGSPVLLWAGRIYGVVALVIRAALMGVIWLLDHPTRLLIAAAIGALAILPLIT